MGEAPLFFLSAVSALHVERGGFLIKKKDDFDESGVLAL
jgi:hypothetical protein